MVQASPGCTRTRSKWRHAVPVALIAVALILGQGRLITPAKAQAEADLPRAPPLAISSEEAEPTPAWVSFCERLPAECAIHVSEPEVISLTPDLWRTLVTINDQVNTTIKPLSDQEHWGVVDRWSYPDDGYGDCEDFQLLKRKRLIESGLPRRVLRMAVVLDQNGEGHAVLMVRTTAGDLVLDNKTSAVLRWRETGYRFVKRE